MEKAYKIALAKLRAGKYVQKMLTIIFEKLEKILKVHKKVLKELFKIA